MNPELLSLLVFYNTGSQNQNFQEVLKSIPHLQVLGQATDPEAFLSQHRVINPDLILVMLNGETVIPGWLKNLANWFPQCSMIVCSQSRDADFLIQLIHLGVREFLPFPLTQSSLESAIERIRAARERKRSVEQKRGQVLVVTGNKGGVGTTTIAVNLAVALAELYPKKVILMDLGRPFPDVGQFLDLKESHTIMDLLNNVNQLDSRFIHKTLQHHEANLSIVPGVPDFSFQQLLESKRLDQIFAILRNLYEWIVVDLSHWIDAFYFNVIQNADEVFLLTELSIPDLKNLKKLFALFRQRNLRLQKIRVLVNRYYKPSPLNIRDLENIIQQPVFFVLPSDFSALIEAIDHGCPLSVVSPRSKLWRTLQRLARELVGQPQRVESREMTTKPNWLRRFFFREART
jgi:pilus assembly protein CpaE